MTSSFGGALVRFIRGCPVTAACIVLAVSLTSGEVFHRITVVDPLGPRHGLGGVDVLKYDHEPGLSGPLALWGGDWWRIPVSGWHHGGSTQRPFDPLQWIHLGMNAVTLAFFGALLEPRLPKTVYILFLLAASVVSVLPEFLLQNVVYGLSGVACAQFGALLVLRPRDPEVAQALPREIVWLAFAWLLLCVPLTMWGIVPIANVAHFAGLAYGWLAGQVFFGFAAAPVGWLAFAALHAAVVPGLAAATQPEWVGRYHWYLAVEERDADRRAAHWQAALERDPGLEPLWLKLADYHRQQRRPLEAWRTLLAGIDSNRTFERGVRSARMLWNRLRIDADLRRQAQQILAEHFGPEAPAWRDRLDIPPDRVEPVAELDLDDGLAAPSDAAPDDRFTLDRPVHLHAGDVAPGERELTAPPVDPDAPDSAALGREL